MDSNQPDLSGERVGRLPQWALVAFGTRCALRVLPALLPSVKERAARRAIELKAAHACCLIPWHTALTEGGRFRDLGDRVFTVFKSSLPDIGPFARTCLVAAVRSASARDADQASEHVLSAIGPYRAVANARSVPNDFEIAAAEDLSELERLNLGDPGQQGQRVPERFFARPLFSPQTSIPPAWQSMISTWAEALTVVKATYIHEWYLRVCGGAAITPSELVEVVNAWLKEHGNDFGNSAVPEAEPPAPETHSQVRVEGHAPTLVVGQAESANAAADVTQGEPATPSRPTDADVTQDEPATLSRPADTWMVSDRPLDAQFAERDRFGFYDYADVLAAVLDHKKTDTPFTMAINAPWGAGKTSLAHMIIERLAQRRQDSGQAPHIICWFNAWMHDDAPNLATALISQVSRTANKHRRQYLRWIDPLPSAVLESGDRKSRKLWLTALIILLPLLVSWWVGEHLQHLEDRKAYETARVSPRQTTQTITRDPSGRYVSRSVAETGTESRPAVPAPKEPVGDSWDPFLVAFQSRLLVVGAFFTALAGIGGVLLKVWALTPLSGFVESPKKTAEAGALPSAELQLKKLIAQATWRGNRFVLFIDDLERCIPPGAVDVLDAVSQLLDHRGVVVVLLGDMSAVAAAAQLKYKDLAEIYVPSAGIAQTGPDRGKEAYGRLYLQKMVQFQFDLPIPPKEKILNYMGELAVTPQNEEEEVGRAGK